MKAANQKSGKGTRSKEVSEKKQPEQQVKLNQSQTTKDVPRKKPVYIKDMPEIIPARIGII
jgi:hypothetical protein